jgi:flagellar hook-associated protein 1
MTLASGALSGVEIDGRPVRTDGAFSPLAGGSLAAAFAVRDDLAVAAQARADGSRGRSSPASRTPPPIRPSPRRGGSLHRRPGPLDPAEETGLAARLSVNALVDPSRGGELWRLRSGLGAAAPGPVGDAALLSSLAAATSASARHRARRSPHPAPPSPASPARCSPSPPGTASPPRRSSASRRPGRTRLAALERRGGVDTDQEMQKLLLIEQVYAANARVISAVDDLIARLLEI